MNTTPPPVVPSDTPMRALSLLVVLVALLVPARGEGDCAVPSLKPVLVTPDSASGHVVPANGSLIFTLRNEYNALEPGTPPDFPELFLRAGRTRIPMRMEPLAPMLARYVPARPPRPGEYEVEGVGAKVRFGAASASAAPPAPQIVAVQRREGQAHYGETFIELRAVLATTPPGVIALIVSSGGTAFGQATTTAGTTAYNVFSAEPCAARPHGFRAPPEPNARVQVRLVGADGRTGPATEVVLTQG